MMRAEPPDRPELVVLTCTVCRREIDCCEFCDEIDCGVAICYRCASLALGQAIPQPHRHGG
jgi:hypothetical protein